MKRLICTFSVGDLRFGVEVSQVQEILRQQELTEVPLAPPSVAGLLNLRGQIVMVVDLRKKFSLSETAPPNPIFIILKGEEGPVCFRADKAGDVLEIDEEKREPLPPQLRESIRNCASGVYSMEDGLIVEMIAGSLG